MSEPVRAYEVAVRQTPEVNMEVIKKYICPTATDQEAFMFMQLCKAQGLNPFLKEAYLVKYGSQAATIITGKDTFTKRADRLPQYDGFKAGVIVLSQGKVTHREGSFFVVGEDLLGGWAEVFRKDRAQSFRNEVSLAEYERRKADGSLMSNWKSMPATMIRKVALVQSLREAFPDEFGGMYSPEEMPVDASALPVYSESEAPQYPAPQVAKPPLKEPAKKVAEEKITDPPKSASAQTATVKIKDVQSKQGEKNGKPYTIFTILDGADVKYGTFSDTFADLARSAVPMEEDVVITFTDGQYGRKVVDLKIAESQREPGLEG
jgi:phage recombination protein Bet